jgi:DNA-binding MarR family transcriptional regulator
MHSTAVAAAADAGGRDVPAGFCLEEFLPYRLSRLATRVSKALAGVYAERFALSIAQWRILATLQAEPGLTARDVAARAALDKVAVSRAVAALGERGLLRRRPVSGDGRASRLQLSRRGSDLFRRIAPLALGWEEELLAPLSPDERRDFRRLLAKLEAHVPAAAPCGSATGREVSS